MCEEQSNEGWRRTLAISLLLTFSVVTNWGVFTNWNYTHWLFNYDFGLIKRGLAGELAGSIGAISYESVRALCAVLAILLAATLVFLFTRVAAVNRGMTGGWLFALFWLTHPCTLPHYLFDMGRLDTLSLLVCAWAVIIDMQLKRRPALVVATLASTLLILVHEANALLFVPLIFACWLYRGWNELVLGDWVMFALGFAWLVGLELVVGSKAAVPGFSLDSYNKYLEAGSPHIDIEAIEPLFRSPGANFTYSASYWDHGRFVLDVVFFVLGLAPSFLLIFQMAKAVHAGLAVRIPDLLLLGAVVSPLLVGALGADHYRWLAVSVTNAGLALVVIAVQQETSARLAHVTFTHKGLLFTCLALHFALGGVAHDSSFDILWDFSDRMLATLTFSPGDVVGE
jgi:hypothetical protein